MADDGPNDAGGSNYRLWHDGAYLGDFRLKVPGTHNVQNACAAIAACAYAGIEADAAAALLADFRGTERRLQVKGELNGVTVVDSYAHHPTEIATDLRAARRSYGNRRIVALFQPHTYSRTRSLLPAFATAFTDADEVLISDIYAAREQDRGDIHAEDIVKASDHPAMRYVGSLDEAECYLTAALRRGDVLLTMGAGDVWQAGEKIVLSEKQLANS